MRVLRWVLGVTAVVLVLIVVAVFILTAMVDPNRYKGRVEAIVGDLTGRRLEISGNLRLSWFPWLGVRTGAAHLVNPPGGLTEPPLIAWEEVQVGAKLIPLLHGQLVVDRIRLQAPHIFLRVNAEGQGNWEDLTARFGKSSGGAQAPPLIAGLEIRDGTLELIDERSGRDLRLQFSHWELDVGAWDGLKPLPVRSSFVLHGGPLPAAGVPIEVDVARMTTQTSPLKIAIPKLSVRIADALVEGGVALENHSDHLIGSGPVSVRAPSLRKLIQVLGVDASLPRDRETLGSMALSGTWTLDNGAFSLKPLEMQVDATRLAGWIERSAAAQPVWSFDLRGDRIDLGRYVEPEKPSQKPFELPVDTLKALRARGTLSFDHAQLAGAQMKDVRLRLESQ